MKFVKMHGLGNDYIYIDCTKRKLNLDISLIAKKICDRHFGIGSDGIILICNSDVADFKMVMYNSDGSASKMCGNGIRCVGKYIYDNNLKRKREINIETLAGIKKVILNINNKDNTISSIKVDMGKPILDPHLIPIISNGMSFNKLNLKILDRDFYFTCVSMGNPHAITIIEDVDNFDVEKYGAIVEINSAFPEKTNVEFIQIIDKNSIKMRVWERGTGETLACGTGACAVAVACFMNNYTNRNVKVKLLGGDLDISIDEKSNNVYMTGPANTCFYGSFKISDYI